MSIVAQLFLRNIWIARSDSDNKKGNAILIIIAIAASILAPIAAQLVSLAISRKREFTADATGVKFTRSPTGLKSALGKIKDEHISENDKHRYPKAVAPLFIGDPYKKKFQDLLSTHPDVNERIRRLSLM